jgi:hypothetical protein
MGLFKGGVWVVLTHKVKVPGKKISFEGPLFSSRSFKVKDDKPSTRGTLEGFSAWVEGVFCRSKPEKFRKEGRELSLRGSLRNRRT